MQDSLPAGGLRLYREGVEPSGSLRKVSGYVSILLSRTSPVARVIWPKPLELLEVVFYSVCVSVHREPSGFGLRFGRGVGFHRGTASNGEKDDMAVIMTMIQAIALVRKGSAGRHAVGRSARRQSGWF